MSGVLILGATGQVGNAIARRLAGDGGEVRALVRSPERAKGVLPDGVEAVKGDVADAKSLQAAFEGISTVYHSAGIPEQWRKDVGEFERVNVDGTRNVVEAALAAGVERFVYTSTDDVLVQGPGDGVRRVRRSTRARARPPTSAPSSKPTGSSRWHWIAACPPCSCTPRASTGRRRSS